jgi:hypothetical protein
MSDQKTQKGTPVPPWITKLAEKLFYAAIVGIMGFGLNLISSLDGGVQSLNLKMATIIERSSSQDAALKNHDERLLYLERLEIDRTNAAPGTVRRVR